MNNKFIDGVFIHIDTQNPYKTIFILEKLLNKALEQRDRTIKDHGTDRSPSAAIDDYNAEILRIIGDNK